MHRPAPARTGLAASLGVALAVLLAGCGGLGLRLGPDPNGPPASATDHASAGAPSSVQLAGSSAPSAPATPLVVDTRLLAVLPSKVGGVTVVASPAAAARMVGDKDLATSASALAVGMAAGPISSTANDLVVATVIQLRPGVFTDDFYSGWRNAYDEAACEPAGGVSGHDHQSYSGRDIDIATCAGGVRTYHVHLDGDILVSVTAVGEHRFGDQLMAGLRR